jgi:ring-1,2-phenylacetyl-CoA epoxidase subunit PaaB
MAVDNARDVYTRRSEGVSIWVVESNSVFASDASSSDSLFEPADSKAYRHPMFYDVPDGISHM